MIIYTARVSARLEYVTAFIGEQIDGLPWKLTTDLQAYVAATGPKINYNLHPIASPELQIRPHGLLFQTGISEQLIEISPDDPGCRFFRDQSGPGFDLFAAVFYLLSRYEEYLPHLKDEYGRYAHTNSAAYIYGFLNRPLIDEWIAMLREQLTRIFPGSDPKQPVFRFIPSYDIDMAWSYRHKGFLRTIAATLKSLRVAGFRGVIERVQVLSGKKADPFDSFRWLDQIHKKYSIKPIYFFLLAAGTGIYDKNTSPRSAAMRGLVKMISSTYPVAIHPSWRSGDQSRLLVSEISTLREMTEQMTISSRQHYIRFTLPGTYRSLINAGIRNEYSMGYGTINGFRASVASPFYWYDLEQETSTDLLLYPFCFMDANAFYEEKLSAAEALAELMYYYRAVKKVSGTFVMIWHNHLLGTDPRFKGWSEIYERFLQTVSSDSL